MKIAQAALGTGAVVGSFASAGCWLLLQLGGVTRSEGPVTALLMYCGAAVLAVCIAAAEYFRERKNGARAIWRRALFLAGAFGLPIPVFYVAVSRAQLCNFQRLTAFY